MRKYLGALTVVQLLLLALLTACQTSSTSTGEMVSVSIRVPDLAAEFATAGVPTVGGEGMVDYLQVRLFDSHGSPVSFTGNFPEWDMTASGGTEQLTWEMDSQGDYIVLNLRPGRYDLEVVGFLDLDMNVIPMVHGALDDQDLTTNTNLNLTVESLLGSVSLTPATPLSEVVPGQVFDLFISVLAPDGVSEVPLGDYSVTYELLDGTTVTGTNLGSSVLGARVKVDDSGTLPRFVATAIISGKIWDGTKAVAGTVQDSVSFPVSIWTAIIFDDIPPTVSIEVPQLTRGVNGEIAGTADGGVSKLQLFEGPILIGSSDSTEFAADGVAQVTFVGTAWTAPYTPSGYGPHRFTAVAYDPAGNTARDDVSANISYSSP